MAHWLLQCNAQKWRIFDFFDAGNELDGWTVGRYLEEPGRGDDIALWVTGQSGGVVAVGTVTGPPKEIDLDDSDKSYWADDVSTKAIRWSLPIRLSREFLREPIARLELARDPRFAQALILRQPQATNPFPLNDGEWTAIQERVPDVEREYRRPTWDLVPGQAIRRTELHERYGGSGRGGIAPSNTTPNILIFTDPATGNQHGYYDEWSTDGTFRYAGQGQRGNQELAGPNKSILDHVQDGRAIRLFEGVGGIVTYVGQFRVDPIEPYSIVRAHSTGGGVERDVIRFHLRRLLEVSTPISATTGIGAPYREQDEDRSIAPLASSQPIDPDAYGRGLRNHRRLQNRLSALVTASGHVPLRPAATDPEYDLAWQADPEEVSVVEVKSISDSNEIRQLRMGIGQLLDYRSRLELRLKRVIAVLYVEREPSDARWSKLAQDVGLILAWPGAENRIGLVSLAPGFGVHPGTTGPD